MKTIDQILATIAWEKVSSFEDKETLAHVAKQASARVLTSGLLPTMAFSFAKGREEGANENAAAHQRLGQAITALIEARFRPGNQALPNLKASLDHLIGQDADMLRRATEEVSQLLGWIGRFADGMKRGEG